MASAAEPISFGPLLRHHRVAAGLTQAALAERAGLSVRAVQHLERSLGQPQRETARRLADALRLAPDHRTEFLRAAQPKPRRPGLRRPNAEAGTEEGYRGDVAAEPARPRVDLGGERKRVTVLVADVAGLTETTSFDPDLADRLLRDAVGLLVEVVHRYGGSVSWAHGDSVMALFGVPVAHEDHAVRACYAALAIHERFRTRAAQLPAGNGTVVSPRVGLDSGEVVVRAANDNPSQEYVAIGPAVRMAARLAEVAKGGTTVLARATAQLAEGYVDVAPLEAVRLLGTGEPLAAFQLTGAQPPRSRFQRIAGSRQLSRFVGRDAELASLSLPIERVQHGQGAVVAIVGEPGVGKSRLIWEVTRTERTGNWLILEAGADPNGTGSAYLPVIDLVKSYCGIDVRDDPSTARQKVIARVLALDRALETDLSSLFSLLGLPVEDAAWHSLEPADRRRRTLDAIRRLLFRETQDRRVMLVVEDLQWIDDETRAVLDRLVDGMPAARMMLLVSYRPEYEHRWANRSYFQQLRIETLAQDGALALLNALLGGDSSLDALKRHLIERTEGNPLFLEESVWALVEAGALVGEHGAYRLIQSIGAIQVPTTVQTVLAARVDRLEPATKRLLQLAAVIGRDVPASLLRDIADMPETDLDAALTRLVAAEFLYEARLFPELEFTFKHALTHEVTYGSLLQDRCRAVHARIVDAIERLYAGREIEQAERLAYHALRGEAWAQVLRYTRLAGRKAASRSALREATAWYEQALVALPHLPESPEVLEAAIDIRLELRSALYPLGEFERIVVILREAEAIAERLDDQRRLGMISAYLASIFFTTGRHPAAIRSAQRTLDVADVREDLGARILGHHYLGLSYYCLGEYCQAVRHLEQNVAALTGDLVHERFGLHGLASVFSRTPLVWSLAERGDFDAAMVAATEEVRIAESADHPYTLAAAYQGIGLLHLRQGDLAAAIAIAERGVEICESWEIRTLFPVIAAQLGYARALSGRVGDGVSMLSEAVTAADAVKTTMNHALSVGFLGEATLLAGRIGEAHKHAVRACDLANSRSEQGALAWALRLRAEIARRSAPPDGRPAVALYREALTLAQRLEMRPLEAHCRLGLGTLLRQAGRLEEAHAELSAAVAMLRALKAKHWLKEAEAALANLAAPWARPDR